MTLRSRSRWTSVGCLLAATAIWLPIVHLCFRPGSASRPSTSSGLSPWITVLAARHVHLWTDPDARKSELDRMRRSNAEWDFMGRTFLALALAEMSVTEPASRDRWLAIIDTLIDETLRLERDQGMYVFLMPYARAREFVQKPARSLFIDSEIAIMIAARRLVAERRDLKPELDLRIREIATRLKPGPHPVAESYPNECWTFDHAIALAALRCADAVDGTDHRALCESWVAMARQRLVEPKTGLLVSSFTTDSVHLDGPEGSSIWAAAHFLRLVDPAFAEDQYRRARSELGRTLLGFSWSREWPTSWRSPGDIDSGAVIPLLDVSAGGSGMAFIAAASFGDHDYFQKLRTTLDFAAFPTTRDDRLQYSASNQVGDAVLLYSAVLGPLWDRVTSRLGKPASPSKPLSESANPSESTPR